MMGKLKAILILIVLFLAPAVGTATELTFPLKTQEHSKWCWAAASQSVLTFYGTNVLQCNIVDVGLNYIGSGFSSCQATDPDGDWEDDFDVDLPYNVGVPSLADIQNVLANWGISSMETGTYLDQKTCASEITAGRPFPIALYWTGGGGHAVVGYGYDGTNTNVTNVHYMDPARLIDGGGYRTLSYNLLVNNPGVSSWGDTLQYVEKPGLSCNTQFAWSITPSGATLSGVANANNLSRAVTFDYGTTTSYGSTVTADHSPVTGIATVSKAITGLAPNTLYHFRVKGVNSAGTFYGTDQTFTTTSQTFSLTTNNVGTGTGTVSKSPTMCTNVFAGGVVAYIFTATPDPGSAFTGWSGDCSGTGDCNLCLTRNLLVTATFTQLETLTVTKLGTGTGVVTSTTPASPVINCGSTCSNSFLPNTTVTLTATPDPGKIFTGWSGACSGTGNCVVTMNTYQSVSATFVPDITPILNLLLDD